MSIHESAPGLSTVKLKVGHREGGKVCGEGTGVGREQASVERLGALGLGLRRCGASDTNNFHLTVPPWAIHGQNFVVSSRQRRYL